MARSIVDPKDIARMITEDPNVPGRVDLPFCKRLFDLEKQRVSKRLVDALSVLYTVEGRAGLWYCLRKCSRDTRPGAGEIVAQLLAVTGVGDGFCLLVPASDAVNAGLTGSFDR